MRTYIYITNDCRHRFSAADFSSPAAHGVYPNIVIKHSSIRARRPRTIINNVYLLYVYIYIYLRYPRPQDDGFSVQRHDGEDPGDRRAERAFLIFRLFRPRRQDNNMYTIITLRYIHKRYENAFHRLLNIIYIYMLQLYV